MENIAASSHLDVLVRRRRVDHVGSMVDSVRPDEVQSLGQARTSLHTLAMCKNSVAQLIKASDLELHERIREVLRMVKEKSDALRAIVSQREEAGEVDPVANLPPTQRENICKNLDSAGLVPALVQQVKSLCESLDAMRLAALQGGNVDAAIMNSLARLIKMKTRPGLSEVQVCNELESIFNDECRWLMMNGLSEGTGLAA